MKKAEKIKKLLEEKFNSPPQSLEEDIKIKKLNPEVDGSYYIFATSDSIDPKTRTMETGNFGNLSNVAKSAQHKWGHDFTMPVNVKYKDKFGWGYKITPGMSSEEASRLLDQLKKLVDEYNVMKKRPIDPETASLSSPEQVSAISQIADMVEKAIEDNTNPKIKENLEHYLDELENAIQTDEVYQFLIESYEKTSNFQKRNLLFYRYSFGNALIIRYADPEATFAASKKGWEDKGYRIKPEFSQGITIFKKGLQNTTLKNAKWFERNPEEWRQYKDTFDIPFGMTVEKYLEGSKKGSIDWKKARQLATFGLNNRFFTNYTPAGGDMIPISTYTDTMIEPIPGVEQVPLDSSEFYAKEDPIQSMDIKKKVEVLFDAVQKIADKMNVNTIGIKKGDGGINQFNRLLSLVALERIYKRFGKQMLQDKSKTVENEELLKGYAEVVSHIVRKNYGLPAESSKYNITNLGADREAIKARSKDILSIAHYMIEDIDLAMGKTLEAIQEARKAIRNILFEHFLNK